MRPLFPGTQTISYSGSETVLRFQVPPPSLRSTPPTKDGDPVPDHRSRRLSRLDRSPIQPVAALLNPAVPAPVAPANIAAPTPSEPLDCRQAPRKTLSCDRTQRLEGSPTSPISDPKPATQSAAPAHPPTSHRPRPCHRGHLSVRGYRRQRRRQWVKCERQQKKPNLPR